MDQHPIPRQITTFEFKLIGFMTLKQFLYLVIFFPIGFIIYKIVPIPLLNIVAGVLVGSVGLAFAFLPFQDRPLEEWLRNFIKRINSPSQYFYKKENAPVYFLKNLYFADDPHIVLAHVESKEKLRAYMKGKAAQATDLAQKNKQHIQDLLKQPLSMPAKPTATIQSQSGASSQPTTINESLKSMNGSVHQPFVSGTVKNRRQIPLPGILVSIKDLQGNQLRLLKTNPHGIFATYSPLPTGDYMFDLSDPNESYFFDTMKVHIEAEHQPTLMFYSKEIL